MLVDAAKDGQRSWDAWRGDLKAVALKDLRSRQHEILTPEILRRSGLKSADDASDNMLMEQYIRPLAKQFQVSREAMRIRLQQLALLVRKRMPSLFD